MTRWTTIYKGNDLNSEIESGKKSYENDYEKVEVIEVRIDI